MNILRVSLKFLMAAAFLLPGGALLAAQPLLLLRTPTVSKTQIAFEYGGDIWIVSRQGGVGHRLVTGNDRLSGPIFSPDGSMIAYSGVFNGNEDVYVVAADGGQPVRLTYHPGPDIAVGWTPDGSSVLFRSNRYSYSDPNQLYTVPVTGGFPAELPLPMAQRGSYSPDGTHLAYVPNSKWEPFWKGYRGGQTTPIWIANLADSSVVKVPRPNSNDSDPMWVGKTVYFLSDRAGPITLFAYNTETGTVSQVLQNAGFDITSASAGPGAIAYSQFGQIYLYNLKSHRSHLVPITVAGDMPQLEPHFEKVATQIRDYDISPTGVRALFEAHGEILTVPTRHGDIRNLTNSPGVEDRDPAWSPDGRYIAYFSDRYGEYDLRIRNQTGLGAVQTIHLGNPSSFYYQLTWSPDSRELAFSDSALHLWVVDIAHPTPILVDTDLYATPLHEFDPTWSPDSDWLTYTRQLTNHLRAVFVYSLASHNSTRITDGMSDCLYPSFDKNGKYIYFACSTNMGLTTGWLDMTSQAHPVTRSVYVAVLRSTLPSPLAPEPGNENVAGPSANSSNGETAKEGAKPKPVKVQIDFAGILQRTLALPIPPGRYQSLSAGKAGELFLVRAPIVNPAYGGVPAPPTAAVLRFDLKSRRTATLLTGVSGFALSFDGSKMLYSTGAPGHQAWFINPTSAEPRPGEGQLNTAGMQVYVVPREEWREMYYDAWRVERAFYPDPDYHGLDIDAAEKEFAAYLPGVASRDGLTFLFREMFSYLTVGHMFVRGGYEPKEPEVNVGLLGADYQIRNGRYQLTKIYNGENWNPQLHAPLTQPGVNVTAGEYLLAVNGRELYGTDNVYSLFMNLAGEQTILRVGPNPNDTGSRLVTVIPVPSEHALRNLAWIEGNRRKVDQMSGGKLAYVYLPDTAFGGFTNFNRYFFSQVNKEGVIIDERFNHGGQLSDYIIMFLNREPMAIQETRHGQTYLEPPEAVFGPKVMIINQFSGSGGDALPWYFRKAHLGPLVGVRTWGGLYGWGGMPILMDGGFVSNPRWALGGLHGHWVVEGHGIPPDITVWQDPRLVREGQDPQLDKAVAVAMQLLKEHPLPHYAPPPYPNYHPHLPPLPNQ
ncbi:MAG TPA: PDZ domain-containing protein [Acidobacteriaceae bacterium]|nr:PDZ domain-containing protein [Acidobacteriaceae bacterium]